MHEGGSVCACQLLEHVQFPINLVVVIVVVIDGVIQMDLLFDASSCKCFGVCPGRKIHHPSGDFDAIIRKRLHLRSRQPSFGD
jgi:hypothetical protein